MAASDGRRSPHQQTLFHLIPRNQKAAAALYHPDNSPFVSTTSDGTGLEVGHHVHSTPRGDVITSLGRDADLILSQSQFQHKRPPFVSSRHVDFQLSKLSQKVMLRVLSKDKSSVSVRPRGSKDADVNDFDMSGVETPQCVHPRKYWGDRYQEYGESCRIDICDYSFNLIWVKKTTGQLQALALKRPAPKDPLYDTHSKSAESVECHVHEIFDTREPKHVSPFTTVHKALDNTTGNNIIVTMIKLGNFGARKNEVRSAIRQEVAFLQKLRHPNIIPCLGSRHFQTDVPVFYTDLAEGDILYLSKTQTILWPSGLGRRMMRQILDALAYLSGNNMSHGSIEPAKILYTYSRTQNKAEIDNLSALCQVMVRVRNLWPLFNPMATEDPKQRASATQMIHFLAGLEGPVQPPVAPAPAPPSLGAGGPTDGPADPGGQKLEQAIIGYNLRNRTVTQRAEQRAHVSEIQRQGVT
ncbi:unnamed protein product, partial [Clonostachys rhizophaga]